MSSPRDTYTRCREAVLAAGWTITSTAQGERWTPADPGIALLHMHTPHGTWAPRNERNLVAAVRRSGVAV